MNAEKLHAICRELQQEINESNLVAKLQQVVNSLQNVVNQPQQPGPQTTLTNNMNQLYATLSEASSNNFSPGWRQTLDEIGGFDLLGERLEERIRGVFERNQITPASALNEIAEMFKSLEKFKGAIDKVVSGFNTLNVGAEELEPGECELGVLVPREAVENKLNLFGEELQQLSFIFNTFSELASGKRENYQIKTISSTDLSIFLATVAPVAACIAYAAEKIVEVYKNLLEIKKIKVELKALGLKKKDMSGITSYANSFMKEGITKITVEVVNEFYGGNDESRKNELKNAVKIALNRMANRIDKGYNIEVRAKPLPEPQEGKEAKVTSKEEQTRKHLTLIKEASPKLQFLKEGGERILQLPEEAEKKSE